MSRKIYIDANGLRYCGLCGTTRSQKGVLWNDARNPDQSSLAHLKHCKGEAGLAQEREEIRAKLAEVPIAKPNHDAPLRAASAPDPAAALPQVAAPGYSSLRAATLGSPYRPPVLRAGDLPAESAPAGFVTQAQYDKLVDDYNLALIERDSYHELAEAAVAQETNHTPHLEMAQAKEAQEKKTDVVPIIIGVGLVGLVALWIFTPSSEGGDPGASMDGSQKQNRPARGGGKILDKIVNKVADRAMGKALSLVF